MPIRASIWLPRVALATIAACTSPYAVKAPPSVTVAPAPGTAEIVQGGTPHSIEPNYERSAYPVSYSAALKLHTPQHDADDTNLEVATSVHPDGNGGYADAKFKHSVKSGQHDYTVEIGQDLDRELDDNTILRFTLKAQGRVYYLRYKKPISLSGLSSPVLLRATGNAAAFKLDNLAPSLATGVRWNAPLGFNNIPFIALNGLGTVLSVPNQQSTFALAAGGELDFMGALQVGVTHHFTNGKNYLVLGLRPELLFKLTSGQFGSQ